MPESIKAIQRWEKLGQQLDKTMQAYLESCTALDLPIFGYSSDTGDLVSKIDDRLHRFDNSVVRFLSSARSSLARVRNKLAAPILRLPVEIHSKIFHLAIQNSIAEIHRPRHLSADILTRTRYDTFHKLLSVCSGWQRTGISQATLWSLVPMIRHRGDQLSPAAAQLSFERASSCGLHLVAELPRDRPDIQAYIEDSLIRYGPRITSINFRTDYEAHLVGAVDRLLEATSNSSRSLQDLSMCYNRFGQDHGRESQDFFSPDSTGYVNFNRLLESLRVLRLCRVNVNFQDVSLRSLTELKLQKVTLGATFTLLTALSSASQLRDIELISVIAYAATPPPSNFQVSLPVLHRLYLEDLYQDTLNFILVSIIPGSYRVILHLTGKCNRIRVGVNLLRVGLEGLKLRDFQIDTLMFGSNSDHDPEIDYHKLLQHVPTATSLYIDSWSLYPRLLHNLANPNDSNSGFPKLTKLHISRCDVSVLGLAALKVMVASHPLEELSLGVIVIDRGGKMYNCHDLQLPHEDLDSIRNWFLSAVPRVIWSSGSKCAEAPQPEFQSDLWPL